MSEIKKVVILNDEIINVGIMEEMPKGSIVKELKMFYTSENGWKPIDWEKPVSEIEQIKSTMDFLLTVIIPSMNK